jgi:energy-converting hydrogenase B subunit Q
MSNINLKIKTLEQKGVLEEITNITSALQLNISYTHLYIGKNNFGSINLEIEDVNNVDILVNKLNSLNFVKKVEIQETLNDIYGKRVIIFGGGAQVSQVAMGAITEADRHNIRGERISIDTIPLVGENDIAIAVEALSRLPRVSALVLAGSLMGGKISKVVKKVKSEHEINVISLNMAGSASKEADLIVTDPIQAGIMAVMSIADTAEFDIKKLKNTKF